MSGAPTDYETLCPKGKLNSRAGRLPSGSVSHREKEGM